MRNILFILTILLFVFACSRVEQEQDKTTFNDTELITLKSGAIVEKIGDSYFYQEDIILSEEQLDRLDQTGSILCDDEETTEQSKLKSYYIDSKSSIKFSEKTGNTKAVGRNPAQGMFWSMLRFAYSPDLTDYQKYAIKNAINIIEASTNVRFFDATYEPTHGYGIEFPCVVFTPSNVNNSYVGRKGGKQIINLYNFSSETIIHEICHALGMFHEQCRIDRDNYITVNYNNIAKDKQHNFAKETKNYYTIGTLDFKSIMLYNSYAFAINYSYPTMTKKDGSTFSRNNSLSENDKRFLNRFYIPYIARPDVCSELDKIVYDSNNQPLSESQRIELERQLNVGRCPYPLPKVAVNLVSMKTSQMNVSFSIKNNESVIIAWGDGSKQTVPASGNNKYLSHNYSSNSNRIIKITGKETAITEISVDRNNLTEFDASKCKELISLSISYNNLKTVDPTKHPKLIGLGFASNKDITSVDLSNNSVITHVSAESTSLSSINVTKNKNLLYLAIAHTNISTVNISNNPSIYTLIFHASKINSLDISKNKNLRTITCRSTPLASNSTDFANFVNTLPSRVSQSIKGGIDYTGNSTTNKILTNKHWYLKY